MTSAGESRIFFAPPGVLVSAGATEMGPTTGHVDALTWALRPNRRVYLLSGDLDSPLDPSVRAIDTLLMPTSTTLDGTALTQVVTPLAPNLPDAPPWSSLRVYDLGACSLLIPWSALDGAIGGGIVMAAVASIQFGTDVTISPGARRLGPQLARQRTYSEAVMPTCTRLAAVAGTTPFPFLAAECTGPDTVEFNGLLSSDSAGGCKPYSADFSTEIAFTVRQTFYRRGRTDCGESPSFVPVDDPPHYWSTSVDAHARTRGACTALPAHLVEAGLVDALATGMPTALDDVVKSISEFAHEALPNQPAIACQNDCDCIGNPLTGPRSRCVDAICTTVVDLDNILITPSGLVVVYAQSTADPQMPVMSDVGEQVQAQFDGLAQFSCAPGRAPAAPPQDTTGVYAPILVIPPRIR